MKLKYYFFAVLAMFSFIASAQLDNGKVYRIKNGLYGTYLYENPSSHELWCNKPDEREKYSQMWIAEKSGEQYAFQNVYSARYVQPQNNLEKIYTTVENSGYGFDVIEAACKGYWDIRTRFNNEWCMSSSPDGKVLSWFAGESTENATDSEWSFEEVAISQDEIDAAREAYNSQINFIDNAQRYYAEFKNLFEDEICSVLKPAYRVMTDDQLMLHMQRFPQEFIDIALKVKNDTWSEYEKEFRVATYKPYSDAYSWSKDLKTNPYSTLNAPTGITCNKGDVLLVFVDKDVEQLMLEEVEDNKALSSAAHYLKKGLNVVTAMTGGTLFLGYKVQTYRNEESVRLADFPDVNVHIERGSLNGYFDKSRHTNEDWVRMQQIMLGHEIVNVKGEHAMFHMHRNKVTAICPNNIYESIDWWDTIVKWEKELMGADKYADRWNNLMLCCDGEGQYMFATWYYTYYEYSTLKDILPKDKVLANPGFAWGPSHEIGHMNQGAINIVSCTEVSNNLFSNMVVQRMGTTTTRGQKMDVCYNNWYDKIPFPLRGEVFSKTRMYWQLYLYFHEAGHDRTFYPRLFEYLREKPMSSTSGVNAKFNQLRFAEACCEIAQMDLSEFFEVWGFFEPMNNAHVGDYADYYVTLSEEDAEASRKIMQQYSKKGGHLMFIEDRVKPSKRTDGVNGNRLDYSDEVPVGSAGEVGQWGDYIDQSVKAQGYTFTLGTVNVKIHCNENAGGAVGFKAYDNNGRLIGVSNTSTIRIPAGYWYDNIQVVAAQADGTDARIEPANEEGSEEQQIEYLNSLLSMAKKLMSKKTTTGREIGYYYTDALATLTELYDSAKAAADNQDTSVHSYKEWAALLQAEIKKISNDLNARAYLKNLDAYRIINAKEKAYQLCYDKYRLKANKQTQTPITSDDKKWMFESTGELHHYYIKNKSGLYINAYEVGVGTSCSGTEQSTAKVFKANYTNDGKIYFSSKEDGTYLTLNSDYNVVCTTKLVDNSMWTIVRVEANNTGIEEVKGGNGNVKTVYDLTGRRIQEITKPGIYIVNGKKVLVK